VGVVPAAVPPRPLPLPTTTPGRQVTDLLSRSCAIGAALTGCLLGPLPGRRLLRRLPERQPGQLRHLLGQRPDLALQLDDPVPQLRRLGPRPLGLRPPTPRLGTPEPDVATTKIAAVAAHDRARRSPSATRVQHPNPPCVATGPAANDRSYGITEYLPWYGVPRTAGSPEFPGRRCLRIAAPPHDAPDRDH
jgi:hypothetical protein